MALRDYAPELLAAALFPLLWWQGRRTRRITPRLPIATGQPFGLAGQSNASRTLRVLGIGESPMAGVGVTHYDDSLCARFAALLAQQQACQVHWQVLAENGARLAAASSWLQQLPASPTDTVDIILLSFGVNDTTAFASVATYRRQMSALLQQLQTRWPAAQILISGVPKLAEFPALPSPLRHVLGYKAASLDSAVAGLLAQFVVKLPLNQSKLCHIAMPVMRDKRCMASDGYHPSAMGAALWAEQLLTIYTEKHKNLPA
ncbi:SGNH/GDSL hydrolase family protein [Undibacterium crateris]|uniref:SGNH/GDSL hydrolase family protein n=1 Tax=Undibacterium crateris TaxID=2528175 RepID=UPI001F483F4D|nr:SGNH/GDSL hydrolase family protein [Undibacterium crateris]